MLKEIRTLQTKLELKLKMPDLQKWKLELVKQPRSPIDQLLSVVWGYHSVPERYHNREAKKMDVASFVHEALELLEWFVSINRPVCDWLVEDQVRCVTVLPQWKVTFDSNLKVLGFSQDRHSHKKEGIQGSPGTISKGWIITRINDERVTFDEAKSLLNETSDVAKFVEFATADLFIEKMLTLARVACVDYAGAWRTGCVQKVNILSSLLASNTRMAGHVLSTHADIVSELVSNVLLSKTEKSAKMIEPVAEAICLLCLPQPPKDEKMGYQPLLDCPICNKPTGTSRMWRCQTCRQPLHSDCFAVWAKKNHTCPCCRSPFSSAEGGEAIMGQIYKNLLPFVSEENRPDTMRFLAGLAVAHTVSHADLESLSDLKAAGFFRMLSEALQAAISRSDWPKGSQRYPQVWKLSLTIERLASFEFCRTELAGIETVLSAYMDEAYKSSSGCAESRAFAERAIEALDKPVESSLERWISSAKRDPRAVPNWAFAKDLLNASDESEAEARSQLFAFALEVLREHAKAADFLVDLNRSYKQISEIFRKHARSKEGHLYEHEFVELLSSIGFPSGDAEKLFKALSQTYGATDSWRGVSLSEFSKWMHSPMQETVRASALEEDSTKNGCKADVEAVSVWVASPSWDNLADVLDIVNAKEERAALASQIVASLCDWAEWTDYETAMLQVLRWCSRILDFCEDRLPYERLITSYAAKKKLPGQWDIENMLAGVGTFLLGKESVEDISPFQRLVDTTFRRQLGRDRRGGLPQRFLVQEVKELRHEANWNAYVAFKKGLQSNRGTAEWPWRLPRTTGKATINIRMVDNGPPMEEGYAKGLGIELSGLQISKIAEGGQIDNYNRFHCKSGDEVICVGDTIKAVDGFPDEAGLKELERLAAALVVSGLGVIDVTFEVSRAACQGVQQLDSSINEWWLWHGAPLDAAKSIAAGQFQVSLARNGMYGPGLYFGESVTKSDEYTDRGYTDRGEEDLRCLLLCRVTTGKVLYNDDASPSGFQLAQQVLGGQFDSILGDREKCVGTHREFIVFNDDAVYPNYAVFYKRVHEKTE
jgi:hypothetical protein